MGLPLMVIWIFMASLCAGFTSRTATKRAAAMTAQGIHAFLLLLMSALDGVRARNPRGSLRTLLEDFFRDRQRGEHIGPADIEGEMRQDFLGFLFGEAVIHRPIEMIGDLCCLSRCDQGANRDQA